MLALDYLSCDWAIELATRGGGLKGKLPFIELVANFYELMMVFGLKLELGFTKGGG